ncbi:hypothetical protein [Mesorhizobium captivum]|uniref:hypothetical protein n=1 Tax=Mesorhizobium captivum TaxID=3072319 RepID=UPI002A24C20F|nr:hypothetical protein [Mesorhizobium sp. VK23E]MDX8515086.1 hypothetical protein [Mesorhizobium sp. VK23E]
MMALAGEGPRTPIDDIAFNLLEGALGVCRRARRNAVDAIILFLNESLDKALDDFGTDRMLRLNPQIPLLQTDLQKCRDLLEGARRRPDHELVRDYEWLESRLPELVDRSQQLGFPRRTRFRERYSQFIWSLTVLLAAITAPILVFALKYSPSDGLRGLPIYAQVALVLGATVATAIIALLSRASRND